MALWLKPFQRKFSLNGFNGLGALYTRALSQLSGIEQKRESMASARWYAARVKPRQEAVALLNLHRQSFETYAPRVMIERVRGKRISIEREPLFPGYILVKFALDNDSWRSINGTRGVLSLLSFSENGIPTPLPTREVESLQRREIAGKLFLSEIKRISRGDCVRVKFGAAADKIGRVIFTRGERVELLLNLLGRQTKVKAPLHAVEVVEQQPSMLRRRSVR